MSRRRGQAGDGKLGCILWAFLVGVAALVAFKMVPVKINSSELYDFMIEQAKFAARQSPEGIERGILRKAADLKLPLDPKNVNVERYGDNIRMRARFTVPVEFPGYTYNWEFDFQVDRPIYIF